MAFSLTETLETLDSFSPHVVMAALVALYTDGRRGLFSDKFVPTSELQMMGYPALRQYLLSLYEIDDTFVERNKDELENLIHKIKHISRSAQQ